MKTSYMLPSGTYNIKLSDEDLQKLLRTGILSLRLSRIPCVTGRAVYDSKTKDLVTLDKKEVYNDLRFHLDGPVADLEGGDCTVQFMNIVLSKDKEKEDGSTSEKSGE